MGLLPMGKGLFGDVMKLRAIQFLRALSFCNPPVDFHRLTSEEFMRPAIDVRSFLGFQYYLMSIPIEPTQPQFVVTIMMQR